MKKILGFTLSELMVAMVVLGILTAAVLPAILGNNPNQNKMMMKKAYYTTAEVVSEMINDESLYPPNDAAGNHYVGFDNQSSVNIDGVSYNGTTKFTLLFFNFINPKVQSVNNSSLGCLTSKTKDGMFWCITPQMSGDFAATILVDVNGENAKPNCYQGSTADNCKNRTDNFDQFRMDIYNDGAIKIKDGETWAQDAITVSSSLRD